MEEFDNKGGKHCTVLHVMYMSMCTESVFRVNRNLSSP